MYDDVDDTVSLNIRKMPKELRDEFKAWCAHNSITMQEAIPAIVNYIIKQLPNNIDDLMNNYVENLK